MTKMTKEYDRNLNNMVNTISDRWYNEVMPALENLANYEEQKRQLQTDRKGLPLLAIQQKRNITNQIRQIDIQIKRTEYLLPQNNPQYLLQTIDTADQKIKELIPLKDINKMDISYHKKERKNAIAKILTYYRSVDEARWDYFSNYRRKYLITELAQSKVNNSSGI